MDCVEFVEREGHQEGEAARGGSVGGIRDWQAEESASVRQKNGGNDGRRTCDTKMRRTGGRRSQSRRVGPNAHSRAAGGSHSQPTPPTAEHEGIVKVVILGTSDAGLTEWRAGESHALPTLFMLLMLAVLLPRACQEPNVEVDIARGTASIARHEGVRRGAVEIEWR
jgi:hypothetical protein